MEILPPGDGKYIAVYLCAADDAGLGLIGLHIVPQHLPYKGDICPAAAQEGGRLKGAHAGLVHKVVGVNDNARIQAVGLHGRYLHVVRDILEHLGNHLAGRGGIGLDVGQKGVVDIVASLPVVVEDHDSAGHVQELRALRHTRPVGVHHDDHGAVTCHLLGFPGCDEHVIRVGGMLHKLLIQWPDRG